MTLPSHALIGLGSNLGDREALLREALDLLGQESDVTVLCRSAFIETAPVGGPPQGPYINGAATVATSLTPQDLLARLMAVEVSAGRQRTVRHGPRTVDLDLLLFDEVVISTSKLTLPHPSLHLREFVLIPAAEIAPDMRHPVLGRTILELRTALESTLKSTSTEEGP